MRRSSSIPIRAAAVALLLAAPGLAAQTSGSASNASRPAGCRGTTSGSSSITVMDAKGQPVSFPDYPVVEEVQPGSPAEIAGMKSGDVVVLQNGRDVIGNPPTQPPLAGDTVQLLVARGGVDVPITLVLGTWDPPQETPDVPRVCRPLGSAAAPRPQAFARPRHAPARADG